MLSLRDLENEILLKTKISEDIWHRSLDAQALTGRFYLVFTTRCTRAVGNRGDHLYFRFRPENFEATAAEVRIVVVFPKLIT